MLDPPLLHIHSFLNPRNNQTNMIHMMNKFENVKRRSKQLTKMMSRLNECSSVPDLII